jgi:penicillin-binding protein 1A
MRTFIIFALALASASMGIFGAILWFALQDLPQLDALKDYRPAQSTIVYDRQGLIIGRLFDERRTVISLQKLPRYVPLAFVAAEDGDFFEHRGIDYFGLLRAISLEIKFRTVGGRRVGGSTITQQTARAMLLSSSQTYVRKIKEIVLAKRIEDTLSKEQILSLYLNQIYFGNGAYGIEEAALTYFDKSASELNLAESAALASVPKSPNKINPFGDIERIKQRQRYVLDQMIKHKFIDQKSAQKAKEIEIFQATADKNFSNTAPYFLSALKSDLVAELGEEIINKGGLKVYSTLDIGMQKVAQDALEQGLRNFDKRTGFRGPKVRPGAEQNKQLALKLEELKKQSSLQNKKNIIWNLRSLNSENIGKDLDTALKNIKLGPLQNNIIISARITEINNKAGHALVDLGSHITKLPLHGLSWTKAKKISDILKVGDIILVKLHNAENFNTMWVSLEQEPLVNGGLVALDVETGGVLAMVGGYDFQASSFNRIMQSQLQPGSGIKPLLYAAALDKKVATASSIITDAPKAFYDPSIDNFWRPRNADHKFLGDITFRHCLRSSINTCSIDILEKVGINSFINLAKQVNLSNDRTPYPRNLTIALGSAESVPINLANAMRILPRGGKYSAYRMINSYKFNSGEEKRRAISPSEQVISPGAAYIITNILRDVIATNPENPTEFAGKTGTTNDARSLWFIGYSPGILALVYVGYDNNQKSNAWGRDSAFPIWKKFMDNIPHSQEKATFDVPDDIEWRYVSPETGRPYLLSEAPPEISLLKEAFLLGTAPATFEEYDMPRINFNNQTVFAP